MRPVIFWLGLHHANWLSTTRVPVMLSFRTLVARRRALPRASCDWMQDSAGFTELRQHGTYRTSPREYAARTVVHQQEIGRLEWAAVQDWMCEDVVLAKTGLSIAQHQARTVASYLVLRELAPEVPWLPVLQGQVVDDYVRHVELYDRFGVDLRELSLVGLGTVCRRQHTRVAIQLIRELAALRLNLHGFGLKVTSLVQVWEDLASADSMAWSIDGRYPRGGRCKPIRTHKSCSNCLEYALLWRERLVRRLSARRSNEALRQTRMQARLPFPVDHPSVVAVPAR